jgi:hypothetical protein
MFHPILVVSLSEVLSRVRSTGLLPRRSGVRSLLLSVQLPCRVTMAQVSRFCSSRVSIKSVFQIMLRSLTPTFLNRLSTSVIFLTPSCRESSVRKTETSLCQRGRGLGYVCITFCMSRRIVAVRSGPLALRSLSRLAIDWAPKSAETGLCGSPTVS